MEYKKAILALITFALSLQQALAQLPPTNMGKFVRQPGDNQYSAQTQMERHPPTLLMQSGRMMIMPGQPQSPVPDVSLEPIPCDEPIKVSGFPPLPNMLDLPVAAGSTWASKGPADRRGRNGNYSEHYEPHDVDRPIIKSIPPAYFQATSPTSDNTRPSMPRTAGPYGTGIRNSDYYGTNTSLAPKYSGASDKDIKALGQEPKLNVDSPPVQDQAQPVVVNQSTTQDLSLPEDEFSYKYKPASGAEKFAKHVGKGVGNVLKKPANMVGGYAGLHF